MRPDQVFLQNITEVFGSDLALPDSLAAPGWANVSLSTSAHPCACFVGLRCSYLAQ